MTVLDVDPMTQMELIPTQVFKASGQANVAVAQEIGSI